MSKHHWLINPAPANIGCAQITHMLRSSVKDRKLPFDTSCHIQYQLRIAPYFAAKIQQKVHDSCSNDAATMTQHNDAAAMTWQQ